MPRAEQVVDRGDGARVPATQRTNATGEFVCRMVRSGPPWRAHRAHSGGCSPFDLAIRVCKLRVGDYHAGEGSEDGHQVSELKSREEGRGDRRGE
eukprot:scaffold27322_cov63-Phaeocystis_antarctica.AAC.6